MKALRFPLTRITLFFVAGILFAHYASFTLPIGFTLSGCCFLALCIVHFKLSSGYSQKISFGLITYFLSFLIGSATQSVHNDSIQQSHYMCSYKNPETKHWLQACVLEKLKSSPYKNRYIVLVKKLDNRVANGKLVLNIQKDSLNQHTFEAGSNLLFYGAIIRHRPPHNPDQFDYGRYLSNKSIPAQMYVGYSSIRACTFYDRNIWYYAALLRTTILDNLQKNNFSTKELNIAAALILGQQQEIAPEILHDYQFAGAVHVLSVSGLHVGYLLLFINFILSGLAHNRTGNLIRLFSVLIMLWAFAVIAGLSPSIVRSVTMFSFVAIGMYLKRETYIFHTLLVSVFLILAVAPSFLFDVGFQLSYVSLFFILWVQPMLSGIWTPTNTIIRYFWDIVTVSFAAQLGAFPLSIYYFHQFPGLFFITNIIILPALGIIMALGVFVMVLAAFNYVPELPSKALESSIHVLNTIIGHIAAFEQFIIQEIPLNMGMLIGLYAAIAAIILWFEKPGYKRLAGALSMVVFFQLCFVTTNWLNQKNREFLVFHIMKNSVLLKRQGQRLIVYANSPTLKTIRNHPVLTAYRTTNFCEISNEKPIPGIVYTNGMKILIIDSTAVYPKSAAADIVILIQSPKINLERLLRTHTPKTIIADGSNYKTYVALWKASCTKQKIPFHATAEKGFYKLE